MMPPKSMVFVIDDDAGVRKGLNRLLTAAGYETEVFPSAAEFLAREVHPGPSCLLVDVQMPGLNGIELQEMLLQRRREEQLIFITGHGDIPMCARAMKAGAVDFLPKPFQPNELLSCVERALTRSKDQRRRTAEKKKARALLDLLTPREFEVMQLLTTGMLNKQVGGELGLAEKTIKVHRGFIMRKLGITSVAELVRLVEKAEVPPPRRLRPRSHSRGRCGTLRRSVADILPPQSVYLVDDSRAAAGLPWIRKKHVRMAFANRIPDKGRLMMCADYFSRWARAGNGVQAARGQIHEFDEPYAITIQTTRLTCRRRAWS